MKYDLKKPCKNCPFGNVDTRISFATRERAGDIEEQAYRQGFPCHMSADLVDDEDTWDGESGGYVEGENTQHCAGAILMYMHQGDICWPGVDNDEEVVDAAWERMDTDYPVFQNVEEFLEANPRQDDGTRPKSR